MKLNPEVRKALKELPFPYEVEARARHIFLRVNGEIKFCIGGFNARQSQHCLAQTLSRLRRLRKEHENG